MNVSGFPIATVEAPEAEEEGRAAADHPGPAAPGRGGVGRDSATGPAEFREHAQQNGAEHGLTGAESGGEPPHSGFLDQG